MAHPGAAALFGTTAEAQARPKPAVYVRLHAECDRVQLNLSCSSTSSYANKRCTCNQLPGIAMTLVPPAPRAGPSCLRSVRSFHSTVAIRPSSDTARAPLCQNTSSRCCRALARTDAPSSFFLPTDFSVGTEQLAQSLRRSSTCGPP